MLTEIRCDKFRQNTISFHMGLNVVLGDKMATNSIGKSTLLMILDFVFGGETFLNHNKDVIEELGHHDYYFSFKFKDKYYYFKRGTSAPDVVYVCNDIYIENESISLADYTAILKREYSLQDINLSFRSVVSLFSRIWGKENLDVKRPLHIYNNQKAYDCVNNTIKLFKKYEAIRELSEELKKKTEEKTTIGKAFKDGYIPKISKTKYLKNKKNVTEINIEIESIKNNLANYAINISEIVNRENMELKVEKDRMLEKKFIIERRLARVQKDLSQNKSIKSKHLESLIKYFPEVNTDRIDQIESFHSEITDILKNELKSSEQQLTKSLLEIESQLSVINANIESIIKNIEKPAIIIDRVYKLSKAQSSASTEIKYYEIESKVKIDLDKVKTSLAKEKNRILDLIEKIINDKIKSYVKTIYGEERRSPTLHFSQNNYSYEVIEDTGTGKAFSNLILFDLALLTSTDLPFIIHDSLLFKNIQNNAVAKLIDLYVNNKKQTFISIDEIEKYGKDAKNKFIINQVIKLDDENTLYNRDWRK